VPTTITAQGNDDDERPEGPAGELEAAADERRGPAPADGEGLTITEAAERFAVSVATVRRAIRAGRLPGAWKVPTPKGDQWRVTDAAMLAAGYTVATAPEVAEAVAALKLAAVEARHAVTEAALVEAQNRIARLEAERDLKAREVELLTASVDDLRAALRKLPDALPAPAPTEPVKRSRWRRRP
jgi:excisionase family DNA binding protein